MSLVAELKRRNVIRMAGLYLVGAWLITQVAGTVLPMFGAPAWIARTVVLLLAIGFVPALIFSWVFELTAQGIRRDAEVHATESIAPFTAQRMNRAIFAVLVLALAYFGFDKFVLAPRREAAIVASVEKHDASLVAAQPVVATNDKSIAVLAFTDLSPQHDQEYFSDGMAEEILNALAQVKDMKVAGRTSSFFYKGRNEDLRSIGKALGVANVLEGSVRKQGDKVRITAQLIRSGDGFHLWSESYDGDLKDVFALQEKIARAITDKLQVVLEGEQKTRLVKTGTENTEAYAFYLQASAIFDRRDGDHFPEAIAALQAAIGMDPKYARAYSRLAALYAILPSYTDANVREAHAKVKQYAQSASALDPTLAEPYAALGFSYGKFAGKLAEQFKNFEHALELEPDDVTTNFWYGIALIKTGYRQRGIAQLDRTLSFEPMLPNLLRWRGIMYFLTGDLSRAEQMCKRARDLGLRTADLTLSEIAGVRSDSATAASLWVAGTQTTFRGMSDEDRAVIADGIYGDAAKRAPALARIDRYLANSHEYVSQMVPTALLQLGLPARALVVMHTQQITDTSDLLALLWSPQGRALRALPEFQTFLRDFGFVTLWDEYGVPDDCRRVAPGNYLCE